MPALPLPRHINSRAELLGKPSRQRPRGDTARLSMPDQPVGPPPRLQAELGQLGRLAGASRSTDNDDRVTCESLENLNSMCSDR